MKTNIGFSLFDYIFVCAQNPALPFGPRGLITVPNSEPFPIGVIDRKGMYHLNCELLGNQWLQAFFNVLLDHLLGESRSFVGLFFLHPLLISDDNLVESIYSMDKI